MSIKIAITSQNPIKNRAVWSFFSQVFENVEFEYFINGEIVPPQPLNEGGKNSCLTRILGIDLNKYHFVVSVENYIDTPTQAEYCYAIIYQGRQPQYGISSGVLCDPQIYQKMMQQDIKFGYLGVEKTYGEYESEEDPSVNPSNWTIKYGYDRRYQIIEALDEAFTKHEIVSKIKVYEDYPKKGVIFQDILPIFQDTYLFESLIEILSKEVGQVDYIVGLESRGFLLGSALASYCKVGFIPIRKKGKLPGEVYQETYSKEYGEDVVEMSVLPELNFSRVIIIDDLIATGGSMHAAINLCLKNNCLIDKCIVLKDVHTLRKTYMEQLNGTPLTIVL